MRTQFTMISLVLVLKMACCVNGQMVKVGFENGLFGIEGDSIAPFIRQGVTVTLESENQVGSNTKPLVLAQAGNGFVRAFVSDVDDTPDGGTDIGGRYNVTDGIGSTRDYFVSFSQPVANVSFDLYDFRGDGPPADGDVGDTVFISVNNGTLVPLYALDGTEPDGNVLNVSLPMNQISSIRLDFDVATYGRDGGTAIDNLMFTVPEPSSAGLIVLGMILTLGTARRTRRGG